MQFFPRFSVKRTLLGCLGVAFLVLTFVNIHMHQRNLSGLVSDSSDTFFEVLQRVVFHQRHHPDHHGSQPKESLDPGSLQGLLPKKPRDEEEVGLPGNLSSPLGGHILRVSVLGERLDPDDLEIPPPEKRPWYMLGGMVRPAQVEATSLIADKFLPEDVPSPGDDDRLPNALMHLPPPGSFPEEPETTGPAGSSNLRKSASSADAPLKKILFWNGIMQSWGGLKPGRGEFLKENCPVSTCAITTSRLDSAKADLVLFRDHFVHPVFSRPRRQIWMMFFLESPFHTQMVKPPDVFNWTATYRSDSTIVTRYGRWQYYNENVRQMPLSGRQDHALNKTRSVAWFVSNCNARNNRLSYANELGKHIQVDVYGHCGTKVCPRTNAQTCFTMLERDYRFYLAFENSNCKDYITEKFFENGLGHNAIPIVMGARPEDYARVAPDKSYIHVDDFDSPKELAEYLKRLEEDSDAYNEYFAWKGTGEFINTKFLCRLCALLHEPRMMSSGSPHYFANFNEWWRGHGVCVTSSWKENKKAQVRKKAILDGLGSTPVAETDSMVPATMSTVAAASVSSASLLSVSTAADV